MLSQHNDWGSMMGFIGRLGVAFGTTFVAVIVSNPFHTIRRRMFLQESREHMIYRNYMDCFRKIIKEEGIRSMFKGSGMNVVSCVAPALVLVFYDQFQGIVTKAIK